MESGSYTITDSWVTVAREFNLSHDDNTFSLQLSTCLLYTSYRTMGKRYANMMLSLLGIIPDANYPRVDKDRRAYVKMCIRDRM